MFLVPLTQAKDLKHHDQTQIQPIELGMLKKIDSKHDSEMRDHDEDLINNNKRNLTNKTSNKTIFGFSP